MHDYDTVTVLYGGYPLGYDDLGSAGKIFPEGLSDKRISIGIYSTGRVIKYEDLGLLEKCPCDTEPLLLTARYVGAALLYIGIIALGEGAYELICLSKLAGLDDLLVSSLLVAPAHVVLYGA